MISAPGNLFSCIPCIDQDKVTIGTGSQLDISHVGPSSLSFSTEGLKLNNVLVVAKIKKNLLTTILLTSQCLYII